MSVDLRGNDPAVWFLAGKYAAWAFFYGLEIFTALRIQEGFFRPARLSAEANRARCLALLFAFFLVADALGKLAGNYLLFAVLRQAAFLFVCTAFFAGKTWMKLFTAGMLLAVMDFSWNGLEAALSAARLVLFHSRSEMALMLASCLSYLGAAGALRASFRRLKLKMEMFSPRCAKAMLIPVCVLLFLTDVVNFGASRGVSMVSDVNGEAYWDPYLNELFTHLGCMVLAILSITVVLCLADAMNRTMQYEVSEQVHRAKAAHYQALLKERREQAGLRHDMRNHFIAVSGLLKKRDYERLEQYVERLCESGGLTDGEIRTGNPAVDAIVNLKRREAREMGIAFACDMNLAGLAGIEDFDLCILLGNLLDNAIHAQSRVEEGRRRIAARAEIVKRYAVFEIRNAVWDGEAGKEFGEERYGIGLMNVKQIVERNGGILDIAARDGEFFVSVMMEAGHGVL